MKCKIPEISWHNRDPVLSVDIQPKSETGTVGFYRLASGGTDAHVLIWYMNLAQDDTELMLDLAADLTRHQRAVNVVKWSPNGEMLASGDDESVIFIWKLKPESECINILDSASEQDKEIWITLKVLRGHMEDVYDLSWCPQSLHLVSGSVDNSAIIWNVQKGKSQAVLNDHKGFVQGVAWDPRNQYIATLSTDRYLRIFDIQTKKVLYRVSKASLPVPEGNELFGKRMRIYHDDTLQTFFRRLCFTPDGKLLITPTGVADYEGVTHPLHTSYIYSRYGFKQPAIVLPCPDQYTVATKCCPLLFKLRPYNPDSNPPVIPLPYRMIFAIATRSSVYLYDTQQQQPFGVISDIHYTRLTDITWSSDGRIIVVSSTDGFCSMITFQHGELGEEYEESALVMAQMMEDNPIKEKKLKKPRESISNTSKCSQDEDKIRSDATTKANDADVSEKCTIETKEEKIERKEANIKTKETKIETKEEKIEVMEAQIETMEEPFQKTNSKENKNCEKLKFSEKDESNNDATHNTKYAEMAQKCTDDNKEMNANDNHNNISAISKEIINNKNKMDAHRTTPSKMTQLESTKENLINVDKTDEALSTAANVAAEITIVKEILSSDEKFKSPEKTNLPVTPISVKRHPSTSSSSATQASDDMKLKHSDEVAASSSAVTLSHSNVNSPRQSKGATPIAVRRTPRALVMPPAANIKTTTLDETMDAWPMLEEDEEEAGVEKEKSTTAQTTVRTLLNESKPVAAILVCTEYIRLTCEDAVEESMRVVRENANDDNIMSTQQQRTETTESLTPKQQSQPNSANKTPRRVALKTISTPKSKKKLIE